MRTKTLLVLGVPVLWLATLGSSVAVIYMRHRASELSFQLSQEHARHARLERALGELQIEQARRGAPNAPAAAQAAQTPHTDTHAESPPDSWADSDSDTQDSDSQGER